jgi:hypothetical protein
MDVTEQEVDKVRRISEDVFGNKDYVEINKVKDALDNIMVEVEATDEGGSLTARNAFGGSTLKKYHKNGYVAVSVGGGESRHAAWFERADEIGFSEPNGEYKLSDDWSAEVGSQYVVLSHNGTTATYIKRDGWTLDKYVLREVIPATIKNELEDIGFEMSDVEL